MPRSNRLKRQPIWGSAQLAAALSALALLLVLAGCVAVAPGAAPATQSDASPAVAEAPPAQVKVAVFPYLSYAPYYIAQAEGFFGDEGLEVEFVAVAQAAESLTALLRGDIDADTVFTLGMVNAIAAGEEVRVVANKGVLVAPECPTDALLVRTELADSIEQMDADQLRALTYSVNLTWFDA